LELLPVSFQEFFPFFPRFFYVHFLLLLSSFSFFVSAWITTELHSGQGFFLDNILFPFMDTFAAVPLLDVGEYTKKNSDLFWRKEKIGGNISL
jgi:hypothetical protein